MKFLGENYQEVSKTLSTMGFAEIELAELNDLGPNELKKAGQVAGVQIDSNELNDVEELNLLSHITIQYHSERQANANQVKVTAASKDLQGKQYEEAAAALKEMGFTNITVTPLGDLKKGWLHDEGEVKEVSIAGNSKFSVNDIFSDDSEIIVFYHSFHTE